MALGTHDFSQGVYRHPQGQCTRENYPNNSPTQEEMLHKPGNLLLHTQTTKDLQGTNHNSVSAPLFFNSSHQQGISPPQTKQQQFE
jgi:hypothetical protein